MASSILTIVLLMVWTMSYSDGQLVFDVVPVDKTCPANDTVTFNCSVRKGEILWFVNDTYALGLPLKYQTFFTTVSRDNRGDAGENSTLQFIATSEANNSLIVCAVLINNELERDPRATAVLIVQDDSNTEMDSGPLRSKLSQVNVQGGNGTVQSKLSLLLGAVGLLLFSLLC